MGPSLTARHVALLTLVSLASLAALAGCRRTQLAQGVSDTAFVRVMSALKRVHDAPGVDSARRAALRDSILQSQGLTPAQLESAAAHLAQNPQRAQTVWQAIERRAADTTSAK